MGEYHRFLWKFTMRRLGHGLSKDRNMVQRESATDFKIGNIGDFFDVRNDFCSTKKRNPQNLVSKIKSAKRRV
jgi:hypothetical protein